MRTRSDTCKTGSIVRINDCIRCSEPLALNLGEHRWLAEDREESYSDWLSWILQGMAGAGEILPLFWLQDDSLGCLESVRRECVSDLGRTDVEVTFGSRGLLLIEVKTKPPGEGLPGQLRRYQTWIERQPVPDDKKLLVFLALEEPSDDITPFTFTAWQALCRRLRQHAVRIKESDLMRAAAILIFRGAAEQNLLDFSARPQRFRAMASVEYLKTWSENE
jgi:hypothetical protein